MTEAGKREKSVMNTKSVAPCGIICDICLGFQRDKNRCSGCNSEGERVRHCEGCRIKTCPEKNGNAKELCNKCTKFPCQRIKNLDKRYRTKYGENVIENLETISRIGIRAFIKQEQENWKCAQCGKLLCVHRGVCLVCGAKNDHFRGITKLVNAGEKKRKSA